MAITTMKFRIKGLDGIEVNTYNFYLIGFHPIYKHIGSIFLKGPKETINALLASKSYIWFILQPLQSCKTIKWTKEEQVGYSCYIN